MHIRLERNQSSPLVGGHSSPALSSRVSSNCPSVEPPLDPAEPEDLEVQFINESFEEQQRQSQMYQSGDLKTIFYQGSSEPESSKTRSDTEKSGRSSVERPERLPYAKKLGAQDSKSSVITSQCQHTTPTQLLNPSQNFEPCTGYYFIIPILIYLMVRRARMFLNFLEFDVIEETRSKVMLVLIKLRRLYDLDSSDLIRCNMQTPGRSCNDDDTEELAKNVIESLFTGVVQTPLDSDPVNENQTNASKSKRKNPDVFHKLEMEVASTSLSEPKPSESTEIQQEGPVVVREEEDEGDSWENLDDAKLEKQISEMKLEAATKTIKKSINYHVPPTNVLQSWDPLLLPHVLEAYDIPEYKLCEDVMAALATIGFGSASVRWIERKIVFVVFDGERQVVNNDFFFARDVLVLYKHDWLRLRPLSKSPARVQNAAKENQTILMPTRVRPKTNAGVARRMVENTLGLKSSATREQRMAERRQIAEAKVMTGHVKFAADPEEAVHDGEIKMDIIDDNSIRCCLGFLQCFHEYSLSLSIPLAIEGSLVPSQDSPLGIRVEDMKPEGGRTSISILMSIGGLKGTVEEKLTYKAENCSFVIILRANILDKDEGTPYLKKGIRTMGQVPFAESDSDTQ
uniref:ULP_PROTEASE domain-containing protein n=1 Tax=Heterorhabditis bacteriophora TaxID=37862 RepID=A0A1I7XCZ2_HETBA